MLACVWVSVITCVHAFYQLPHISLSNAAFKWQIAQKNKHTRTSVHTRTHTCQHVCMHKCIFVFHFFCFCFASCFLFGAVLLTWLKLEHNNNKSLQWNFATHTREHVYMYTHGLSHTHTVSWKPYSAQLILLCCCCCFFFFLVVRFGWRRKSINFYLHFSLQFRTLFMPFGQLISFCMHSLTFILYFATIYN